MDAASANATYLLVLLCLSVVLLLVHILLQGNFATKDRGTAWNAGPRDGDNEPQSVMAGRAARASRNYQETYPAFIGLLLAMILTGDSSGFGLFVLRSGWWRGSSTFHFISRAFRMSARLYGWSASSASR